MKTCTQCTKTKDLSEFYSVSNKPGRPRPECKQCTNKYNSLQQQKRKDVRNAYKAEWAKNNIDKTRKASKDYRLKNPGLGAALVAKRRAAKLQRTPKWLTKGDWIEIRWAYDIAKERSKETGIRHEVDHEVPLQGEIISGLHVPWNLQVLTEEANSRKGNKFGSKE